jgi:hypothetical protein
MRRSFTLPHGLQHSKELNIVMKMKRYKIAALVVGLLLVLSNDALAFYNPQTGRWLSRDPVEEISWFTAVQWLARVGMSPHFVPHRNTRNPYHFVFNDAVNSTDDLGLQPSEGDSCSCNTCKVTASFEPVSASPTCTGGGCTRRRATSWSVTVRVNYKATGDCVILGCKYWTCNLGLPRGTPTAYTSAPCGGWTYDVGGPVAADYHAKSMEGVVEYLSCENGKYVKKELSAGTFQSGFYYDPPVAWVAGRQLYP